MEISDLAKNLSKQTERSLDRRMQTLLKVNPHYRDLDKGDRQVILDLLKKYKERKRKGITVSDYADRKSVV